MLINNNPIPDMPMYTPGNTARSTFVCLIFAAAAGPAHAQLYTWKDPQGTVVIKNSPPPWYRENEKGRGPRVQVLRDGKIIDDTGLPLEKRLEGRAQAARQEQIRAQAKADKEEEQADAKGREESSYQSLVYPATEDGQTQRPE